MGDISRPDVLQNFGIINYIQQLLCIVQLLLLYVQWVPRNYEKNFFY